MPNSSDNLNKSLEIPIENCKSKEVKFKSHYMRIPTYIFFLLLNMQCALTLSSYTPLNNTLSRFYKLKTSTIVLSSTLFLIGNTVSLFLVYPINKNWGVSTSVRIGLFFNILGAGLRVFINKSFIFVLFGQFLLGVATSCMYNNQMEFNFNWFNPKSRAIFNSILTLSVYIGGGLGNTVPIIFVNEASLTTSTEAHSAIYEYSLKMFIFICVLSLVNLLIFRGGPPKGYG